jgi:hypothetical protein
MVMGFAAVDIFNGTPNLAMYFACDLGKCVGSVRIAAVPG